MCHFVLVFFSPFSIAITSLGEERANLSAFRTFVRFVLVWICRFSLPLGVWEGLRFVIVALLGLFSYLFLISAKFMIFFLFSFFFLFVLCIKIQLVVNHRNRLSKAALMNTNNMFNGELQILTPLYRQMPSLSISYLHKF